LFNDLRKELVEVARRMNGTGLNQGTSGNLSARIPGGLLITPSLMPKLFTVWLFMKFSSTKITKGTPNMKQHRRSALRLLAFILFTASFHTSSQAAPEDHDGIWNAVIDCEPVQWKQNNTSRSAWRLPSVEIRRGSTQQVMQLKEARYNL